MTVTPVSTRVMNLSHYVEQNARRLPDNPAFAWGDTVWSWTEFDRRVKAMAAALAADFGLAKGDRVLVHAPNCNRMFESFFACLRLGAVWVPANVRGTPAELDWMARSSGAVGLICDAAYADHAAIETEALRFRIGIGGDLGDGDYDALVVRHRDDAPPPLAPVDRDDPCWFFYTSGTTGQPKAAVLTHGQLGFVINNHLCDLTPGLTEADASVVVAPLSHGAGMHQLLMVARGAPTILPYMTRFDPDAIWQAVAAWRATNIFTVPTILKMLVEDAAVHAHDHSSLRYVIYAGAPMYRTDQVHALEVLGPVLVQYFGLGEVTGAITVLPPRMHSAVDDGRAGTCGIARTGMQVEVQDSQGAPLPPGETGEICVTGPAVFAAYWNDDKANAESFRNGWFRTGDVGHMDAEGFFYITGRQSDMYISGGSNIYPRSIEEKILEHPGIAEAAVFGMPDPKWGEIGVAVCVARGANAPDAAELETFLRARIAGYKLPKQFHFWDELPKSGYGKLAKRLIRDELLARTEADTGAV